MAEINWTPESEIWLEDIYDYIAADDPEAAERTVTLITKRHSYSEIIRGLATNTNPNNPARFDSLYEHYRIAYLVKPGGTSKSSVFFMAL